jgi:hypothetical protein
MTELKTKLKNYIEKKSKDGCFKSPFEVISFQEGAEFMLPMLIAAIEGLKWTQKKSAHMKSDGASEINRKTTVAIELIEGMME